jgi:glycosyltransferase involved in cell wall biosynthesis
LDKFEYFIRVIYDAVRILLHVTLKSPSPNIVTMKKTPSVSVIIPTYNRFHMLCEAIDSVLAQTDSDYELIVVDDGSTDKTGTIQELYKGKLHYIYQENSGASAARNRGAVEARGEWIAFLDSDDLWQPEKLETQRAAMEGAPELKVSYTNEIWYRRGVRVNPGKKHAKYSGRIFEKCLPLCIISPSSVMIQKQLFLSLEGFNEDFPVCEDYDLWLRITKDFPVLFIPDHLIIKRNGHSGQLSASGWGFDRYRVQSIAALLKSGELTEDQASVAQKVLSKKCRILSNGFNKRGNLEMGKYYENFCDV